MSVGIRANRQKNEEPLIYSGSSFGLGEKIRTSGLLNPIQKISFAFYAVFCLYFRISSDKCGDILNNHPSKGKSDHVLTTHINF